MRELSLKFKVLTFEELEDFHKKFLCRTKTNVRRGFMYDEDMMCAKSSPLEYRVTVGLNSGMHTLLLTPKTAIIYRGRIIANVSVDTLNELLTLDDPEELLP